MQYRRVDHGQEGQRLTIFILIVINRLVAYETSVIAGLVLFQFYYHLHQCLFRRAQSSHSVEG